MKDTAGKNLLAPAGLDDEDDIFAPVIIQPGEEHCGWESTWSLP